MAKQVQPNYTEAQTTQLVRGYQAGNSVEFLAQLLGKTTRSVVAKLSREGVYQPKTAAAGTIKTTKTSLVVDLEHMTGAEPGALESLERADKAALKALHEYLAYVGGELDKFHAHTLRD